MLTGLAQSYGFCEWLWQEEQRTTEHTQSGLSPLTGSPPQSFMFMLPLLFGTELVRVLQCFFVCMCSARGALSTFRHLGAWAHSISQIHPAEVLLLPGSTTERRYETWHHGRRLTKTIRVAPWTSHTSTFSRLLLQSSSTLIMPSQRESTQQHKHGYIGLYPVQHLRLCTFLHHVLMDNLACLYNKHA